MRPRFFDPCEGTATWVGTGEDKVEESGVKGAVPMDESDVAREKTLSRSEVETGDALDCGLCELEHAPYAPY